MVKGRGAFGHTPGTLWLYPGELDLRACGIYLNAVGFRQTRIGQDAMWLRRPRKRVLRHNRLLPSVHLSQRNGRKEGCSASGARYASFAVQTAIAFGELKGRRGHRPRRTEQDTAREPQNRPSQGIRRMACFRMVQDVLRKDGWGLEVGFGGGVGEVGDDAGAGESAEVGAEVGAEGAGGGFGGAEVGDAGDGVADEDVVGADAVALELGTELGHDGGVVVDAA